MRSIQNKLVTFECDGEIFVKLYGSLFTELRNIVSGSGIDVWYWVCIYNKSNDEILSVVFFFLPGFLFVTLEMVVFQCITFTTAGSRQPRRRGRKKKWKLGYGWEQEKPIESSVNVN